MQVPNIRYCKDIEAHYCDYEKPADWWNEDSKQNSDGLGDESRLKVKSFVEHAKRLVNKGQIDAALDLIYDRIDTFLLNCKFQEVDSILRGINPDGLSVDILLGLLTCTLPARTKLSTRAAFFVMVEQEIKKRGEWEVGLLSGLES